MGANKTRKRECHGLQVPWGNWLADWPGLNGGGHWLPPPHPSPENEKKTFKKEFDLKNYGSVLSAGGVDIFATHQDSSWKAQWIGFSNKILPTKILETTTVGGNLFIYIYIFGQMIIFNKPRFPWNKGISLPLQPFGLGVYKSRCEILPRMQVRSEGVVWDPWNEKCNKPDWWLASCCGENISNHIQLLGRLINQILRLLSA